MLPSRFPVKWMTACFALILGVSIGGVPLLALAQQYNPPRRGLPGRRVGAGTRGETCLQGTRNLTPLMPVDGFSTTTSKTPTFFWYVPETTARTGEFSLLNGQDKLLYRTQIRLVGRSGITSYRLPTTVAATLKPGQPYRWQLSITCDSNEPSRNPFVNGLMQRVEPNSALTRQLKQVAPGDRATVYAAAGIWQDALATLAEQRCFHPGDASLRERWARLLQSAQLAEYSQEPLSQVCPAIGAKPMSLQ